MEQETNGFRPARLSWVLAFGTGAMVVAMLFLLWLRADLRHVEQIDTPQPLMPVDGVCSWRYNGRWCAAHRRVCATEGIRTFCV